MQLANLTKSQQESFLQSLGVPCTTSRRHMKVDHTLFPYWLMFVQELSDNDFNRQCDPCGRMLKEF